MGSDLPSPVMMAERDNKGMKTLYQILRWFNIILCGFGGIYSIYSIFAGIALLSVAGNKDDAVTGGVILLVSGFIGLVLTISVIIIYIKNIRVWMIVFGVISLIGGVVQLFSARNGHLAEYDSPMIGTFISAGIDFAMADMITKGYHL